MNFTVSTYHSKPFNDILYKVNYTQQSEWLGITADAVVRQHLIVPAATEQLEDIYSNQELQEINKKYSQRSFHILDMDKVRGWIEFPFPTPPFESYLLLDHFDIPFCIFQIESIDISAENWCVAIWRPISFDNLLRPTFFRKFGLIGGEVHDFSECNTLWQKYKNRVLASEIIKEHQDSHLNTLFQYLLDGWSFARWGTEINTLELSKKFGVSYNYLRTHTDSEAYHSSALKLFNEVIPKKMVTEWLSSVEKKNRCPILSLSHKLKIPESVAKQCLVNYVAQER